MIHGVENGRGATLTRPLQQIENARFAPDATYSTWTDQLVILNVFEGVYPQQIFSIEPGESSAEKCFCGGWSGCAGLLIIDTIAIATRN